MNSSRTESVVGFVSGRGFSRAVSLAKSIPPSGAEASCQGTTSVVPPRAKITGGFSPGPCAQWHSQSWLCASGVRAIHLPPSSPFSFSRHSFTPSLSAAGRLSRGAKSKGHCPSQSTVGPVAEGLPPAKDGEACGTLPGKVEGAPPVLPLRCQRSQEVYFI